ncbi:MAG: 50S ribosomal protein L11 methyltransferase [Lentisphaeria bacterium]|nr:50S ribosomal protein L11 methyltransferase [Lentisphaeria bacterium]
MTKTNEILYCCSFADNSDCPDAAPELLSALGYEFSSWKDEESGKIRHTVYFPVKEDSLSAKKFLEEHAPSYREFGVILEDFKLCEVKKEDWAESWKIHFQPLVISPRLAVAPSWSRFKAAPGQQLVTLDPGMSFGTGQHATTKFCLSAIDRFSAERAAEGKSFSLLDAGSGSGILFIAACKLGAEKADAFDIDLDTIPVAKENALLNHIPEEKFSLRACSLLDFPAKKQYEIVVANILSGALIEGKEKLLSCCMDNGILILAGILHTEYEKVRASFEGTGLCTQLYSFQEKEWRGGAFRVHKKEERKS